MLVAMAPLSPAQQRWRDRIEMVIRIMQPGLDLIILLPTFAAVTIGGLDSVFGAVGGALVLSLAQNLLISVDFGTIFAADSWYVPTQFRDYIAVGALVVILLFRPRRAGLATR